MIRITDATMSYIDNYNSTPEQLNTLLELLISSGIDFIEMSIPVYFKLGKSNPEGKYVLRLKFPEQAEAFPEINRFVCRRTGYETRTCVVSELQANDMREIYLLKQYKSLKNVRICGLDDIIAHDYISAFTQIRSNIGGRIEFCPEDKYYCATAIAVEWAISGGTDIVTTFAGIGGKAATEEVMLALRFEKRRKPNLSYMAFPQIRDILEEITGQRVPDTKAVIGRDIFNVESGIHVNGINKNPMSYEPFNPELVGNQRKIVIGKHSGKCAVELKLKELNLYNENIDIGKMINIIQKKSIEMQSSLTDDEFTDIAKQCIDKVM